AEAIFLDAKFESELIELDEDEAAEMLESTGQEESGLDQLARVGFDTLGLQTYLTAGPKESRAWTIPKGATAPQAAGVIHTGFERGCLNAELVSFDRLMEAGSMAEGKAKGWVRMEGKDYVVRDGDVVEWRFNLWAWPGRPPPTVCGRATAWLRRLRVHRSLVVDFSDAGRCCRTRAVVADAARRSPRVPGGVRLRRPEVAGAGRLP